MKKRIFAPLLCLALCLTLLPAPASAASAGATVMANISGADIYVGEAFSGEVTKKDASVIVQADSAGSITVSLPGYTATYEYGTNSVTATLTPELYPADWDENNVTWLTVGDGTYGNLSAALEAAKNGDLNKWYVIEFAPGVTTDYSGTCEIDDSYLTINGGGDVVLSDNTSLKIYGSDIRIIGLKFAERTNNHLALQMRVPDDNNDKAYNMDNIYVLGCTFDTAFEVGVATCGADGNAGTAYGGAGTANFKNLVFAGNTFKKTDLFSFAGAGDEDYNVIDGYKICGNTFTDGGVGMLAGDAHTWYVYGWVEGQTEPKYCEYNKLMNVLVSGNSFTMTENATAEYTSIISVSCANLGNDGNLVEEVVIRNNISRIKGGEKNCLSSVSITGTAVCDEGEGYTVTPGMHNTDNNTIRNVKVYNNDFQLGTGRDFQVYNLVADKGGQYGKNNVMENIEIFNNIIEAQNGVKITNYTGNHLAGECSGNDMRNISFRDNTVKREVQEVNEAGILVAGSYLSNHGQPAADYPSYSGEMSDITVSGNTVTGYKYGVVVAGSAGDYGVGLGVSDVTVSGNDITTALYNNWPEHDFGVVVAGSCLQTNGKYNDQYSPLQPSNISCFARNVTVSGNSVSAQGGILVTGNFVNSAGKGNPTGNYVSGVEVTGNELTLRVQDSNPVTVPAILVASDVDPWAKMNDAGEGVDAAAYFAGCFAENVTVDGTNTESGFDAADIILSDNAPVPEDWTALENGLYSLRLEDVGINMENAYFLPVPGGQTHITVKRTGLVDCKTAVAALYDKNGRLLELAMGNWAEDVLTLALDNNSAAVSGKVFFLSSANAPLRGAYTFTP